MTRDEVENIPAGREMDKLVFEKIIDFSVNDNFYILNYSTDIAAAYEVIKEMNARNYWFGCQTLSNFCLVWFNLDKQFKAKALPSELPLAICRAALLATL